MKFTPIIASGIPAIRTKKIKAHIEVVGSTNSRLNAMTHQSRHTIVATLRKKYTNVSITIVNNMQDLENLVVKQPDLVVLGMKLVLLDETVAYDDSPKVWLSSYLEQNGIHYTGSETTALELEFDKHKAKQATIDAHLRSSAYFISTVANPTYVHTLQFPLFVKPTNRGDSKGIDEQSLVYSDADLRLKIESIHSTCGSDALIEEYLPGREFSVAVIRQPNSVELLAMPIEITAPADAKGNVFLSAAVKVADSEKVLAIHDEELKSSLNKLAIGVFNALDARDYGRIDMRIDNQGQPSFIEANLMPGLSDHGYLARCFYLSQRTTYADMILAIVALGFARTTAVHQPNVQADAMQSLAVETAV